MKLSHVGSPRCLRYIWGTPTTWTSVEPARSACRGTAELKCQAELSCYFISGSTKIITHVCIYNDIIIYIYMLYLYVIIYYIEYTDLIYIIYMHICNIIYVVLKLPLSLFSLRFHNGFCYPFIIPVRSQCAFLSLAMVGWHLHGASLWAGVPVRFLCGHKTTWRIILQFPSNWRIKVQGGL